MVTKEFIAAQNKISDMEKSVRLCESRTPEISQASMRFLDIAYYAKKDIDEKTYFEQMDKLSILSNKFRHECSCTKLKKN